MIVRVKNWRSFNPRADVKKPSWFRLSHDLFEDPDFYDFTQSELMSWVYLLCQASKKNSESVRVNIVHVERIGRIKEKDFLSAIRKLESLQIILVGVTDTLRARDDGDTHTNATDERDGRTNETRRTEVSIAVVPTAQAAPIAPQLMGDYSLTAKELLAGVPMRLQESWLSSYPDPAWIKQEINKAASWILSNPKKAPKKFPAFMSSWLSRGWEQFRKTLPSNPAAGPEPGWVTEAKAEEARRKNAV